MASELGTSMLGDAAGLQGSEGYLHTDRTLAFIPKKMWMTVLFVPVFCESLALSDLKAGWVDSASPHNMLLSAPPRPWVTCYYISVESSAHEHLSVKIREVGQRKPELSQVPEEEPM